MKKIDEIIIGRSHWEQIASANKSDLCKAHLVSSLIKRCSHYWTDNNLNLYLQLLTYQDAYYCLGFARSFHKNSNSRYIMKIYAKG